MLNLDILGAEQLNRRLADIAEAKCYTNRLYGAIMTTHGKSHCSKLYRVWTSIKHRCNNPQAQSYGDYGGRHIKVCEAWSVSFEAFEAWALSNGYKEGLTIDRKKNDLGYSPLNCRWITRAQNNLNRRGKAGRLLPKGVTLCKGGNYKYQIMKDGVWYREFGFKTVSDALEKLLPLRKQLHGDYSCD